MRMISWLPPPFPGSLLESHSSDLQWQLPGCEHTQGLHDWLRFDRVLLLSFKACNKVLERDQYANFVCQLCLYTLYICIWCFDLMISLDLDVIWESYTCQFWDAIGIPQSSKNNTPGLINAKTCFGDIEIARSTWRIFFPAIPRSYPSVPEHTYDFGSLASESLGR